MASASASATDEQNEMIRHPLACFPQGVKADRFKPIVVDEQIEMASASASATNEHNEMILRPLADFPEGVKADRFKPIVVDEQVYKMQTKEIEMLKVEVGSMLIGIKEGTTIEKLMLIDTLEQLGISYHFEKQIESLLQDIFLQNANSQEEYLLNDLHATALLFRLLRQHAYNISSGIFDQFLDSAGNFRESLSEDKKGLLSLYEAADLRRPQESILEEALSFTSLHLRQDGQQTKSSLLAKLVNHALEQPLHRGVQRADVRHFISIYEDMNEGKSPLLLRFAKLDYNHMQILYRKEIDELFRQCKDMETASKVPYARDRLVESYFWALSISPEPQYSLARSAAARAINFITLIDDTYDAYGRFDELKLFRDALERWNVKEIDEVPEYMKLIYIDLVSFVEWIAEELARQGKPRPYALSMIIEEWKQYVRANYTQSLWLLKRELPAFQDYQEIALITVSFFIVMPALFSFMESGTEDVFDWLAKQPKILTACSALGRFLNDISSHETEKQRGATGLECYMKHYNVSEVEAKKKLEEIAEKAWKDVNEELILMASTMPREILKTFLNLARIIHVTYQGRRDGYTDPAQNLDPHIQTVLLDIIGV